MLRQLPDWVPEVGTLVELKMENGDGPFSTPSMCFSHRAKVISVGKKHEDFCIVVEGLEASIWLKKPSNNIQRARVFYNVEYCVSVSIEF